jgi:hypothetical protein
MFSGRWKTETSLTRFCSRHVLVLSLILSTHAPACLAGRQLATIYLHLIYGFNQHATDIVFHRFHLVLYLSPDHLVIFVLLNSVPKINNIERDRVYVPRLHMPS